MDVGWDERGAGVGMALVTGREFMHEPRTRTVLTIAGSDSGGGAGVQADLKTFAALGVHGACAITAITAQNTLGVQNVFELPKDVITGQIRAVLDDIHIDYAKIGMLSSKEIVRLVASHICGVNSVPFVLDPVMSAEAGGSLLTNDALKAMVSELIPAATVVTPNVFEAEAITGIRIRDTGDAKRAAAAIVDLGCRAAVVTGGHLHGTDVLCDGRGEERFRLIPGNLIKGGTHGAGCTYSSAIAAFLAKGLAIPDACIAAKDFVMHTIQAAPSVGGGVSPVNQTEHALMDAARYRAIADVSDAVNCTEACKTFTSLIPEVGCNIGTAIPQAQSVKDIAAVRSRIVRFRGAARAIGRIEFGASSHVARLILAAMRFNPEVRSAINIRYSEEIISTCEALGYTIASFDREDEPPQHQTMDWGTAHAIKEAGYVPQIIYDRGGTGKEAMVRILGSSAMEVAGIAIRISRVVRD
ncbi:MAG: bifunctional hydroxymethylpyrimidine kinase/phosphomethylpyrimidine kinase [Euryarchaeota archaeon]|nr:bifunctional hydroxymethylpyrimidine kinase/phosphomethylpyrimidine kinase [Euryarchaeota archaeon]